MTLPPAPPTLDYERQPRWRPQSGAGIAAFVLALLTITLMLVSAIFRVPQVGCASFFLLPLSIGIATIELIVSRNRRQLYTYLALGLDALVVFCFAASFLGKA